MDETFRRDVIRSRLDAMRAAFHALLGLIPDQDLGRVIPGNRWSVKAEFVHIVQAAQLVPGGIDQARHGQRTSLLSFVPSGLRDWVNGYILIPLLVRNATRESIVQSFDRVHAQMIAKLDALASAELDKGTVYVGRYRTIEQIFHRPVEHFEEHAAHIRSSLNIHG
jgi:hypothetical protein